MYRRRLIRSGHFGALRRNISEKREGITTVKRTKIICASSRETTVAILNVSYTIYRPDLIYSTDKKPLLVIHGGPGIPSDYLQPMAQSLKERCIIFYDQIGCGNSSRPKDLSSYSIQSTVGDLEHLVQHLKLKQFHLYGHSFGAIVAYEYSKGLSEGTIHLHNHDNQDEISPRLLSVTLCSAPSNLQKVEDESKMLLRSLRQRSDSEASEVSMGESMDGNVIDDSVSFQNTFVCRTSDGALPRPLQEAYSKKGDIWEGTEVIIDYVAQPPSESASNLPPTLLLRGEHDFVSEKFAFDEWKGLINHDSVHCQTLGACSHYSMLENSELHSMKLDAFFDEQERNSLENPSHHVDNNVTTVSQ